MPHPDCPICRIEPAADNGGACVTCTYYARQELAASDFYTPTVECQSGGGGLVKRHGLAPRVMISRVEP
jgi:hypothetical protein